jgi:arylesterase/paraoxonase
MLFDRAVTSIGYCHVDRGCKIATHHLPGSNGIARSNENTFFVGSTTRAEVRMLERQSDDSLVVSDVITYGSAFVVGIDLFVLTDVTIVENPMPVDNLSVDGEGAVWAAAFPSSKEVWEHLGDPVRHSCSSTALRIAFTAGNGLTSPGNGYNVDTVSCQGLIPRCKLVDRLCMQPFRSNGTNHIASGTTTVVHDTQRHRLFLSGRVSFSVSASSTLTSF